MQSRTGIIGKLFKSNSLLRKDISVMVIPFIPLEPFFLGFI